MKKLVIGIVGFLAIVGFGVYLASQDGENNKFKHDKLSFVR